MGELSLTPHLPHPVTSPAVCVQVVGGPPLIIPYFTPAFTTTLGQPQGQARQFTFQRGKSCIFSAPHHPFVASKGASVRVEVLCNGSGGVGVQSALVGCHEGRLVPQGESVIHMGLRGTVSLTGRDRETVGTISLSISLKCLGVEVPGGDRTTHTSPPLPGTYEESFSVLQDAQVPYESLPASEKIALKIASLEDPASFQGPVRPTLGEWQDLQAPRRVGELAQPPPILYMGWNAEGARIWEEKVGLMNQEETQEHGVREVDEEVDGEVDVSQSTDSDTSSKSSQHPHTHIIQQYPHAHTTHEEGQTSTPFTQNKETVTKAPKALYISTAWMA